MSMKLSFLKTIYVFVRYMLMISFVVSISIFQFSSYSYAKSGDKIPDTSSSMNKDVYKELTSGHKVMQEQVHITPEKPTVYLTFDDGPSKLTPRVLDLLKKANIKATFFLCGDQLKGREEIVKRMIEEGHTIGNHSYNHEYSQLYSKGFSGFWDQIQKSEDKLKEILGYSPMLVRAPGGTGTNFDAFYFYYLDQAGYSVYDWDVDSKDSRRKGVPSSEIIASVKNTPLKHELTVLLHDGAGHEQSVVALPDIIQFYQSKGYEFAPLTSDVKPTQFKVSSKLKWQRSNTVSEFNQQLDQSRVYAEAHNGLPVEESTLVASLSKGSNILAANSTVVDKLVKVPLRSLVEGMGASVTWNEVEKSILIRLGKTTILYTDSNQQAEVFQSGRRVGNYDMSDIERIDDRYYVSVSSMMKLLANAVDGTNQQYFPGKGDQLSSRTMSTVYDW